MHMTRVSQAVLIHLRGKPPRLRCMCLVIGAPHAIHTLCFSISKPVTDTAIPDASFVISPLFSSPHTIPRMSLFESGRAPDGSTCKSYSKCKRSPHLHFGISFRVITTNAQWYEIHSGTRAAIFPHSYLSSW